MENWACNTTDFSKQTTEETETQSNQPPDSLMQEATSTPCGLQWDWHRLSTFENLLYNDLWQAKHCKPSSVPESECIDCLIHWKKYLKLRTHQLRKRCIWHRLTDVQVSWTALLTLTKPPPVTLLCLQLDCSRKTTRQQLGVFKRKPAPQSQQVGP